MGHINDNISVGWLLAQLQRESRTIVWGDCDGEVDVRLQATEHDGWLHVGDASFDTDHTGYWGVGVMTQDMGLEELGVLAEDLIQQASGAAAKDE